MKQLLGILGGMGPLVSAEFLKTIYEFNIAEQEQEAPACILYSDPKFPDRTDAILMGSDVLLIKLLVEAFENLDKLGVDKVVITCITMHYFLPKLPLEMQEKVISLVDVIIEEVFHTKKRHLLLCAKGTCKARIFQENERWIFAEQYVLFPSNEEQNIIHGFIYKLKKRSFEDSIISYINYLDKLVEKYQVDFLIAGCTEFHLVTKYLMKSKRNHKNYSFVDPLLTLAANLRRFINA